MNDSRICDTQQTVFPTVQFVSMLCVLASVLSVKQTNKQIISFVFVVIIFIAPLDRRLYCIYSGKIDEIPKFESRLMWPRLCPLLTYFWTAYFSLLTGYLHEKFELCSFSRLRNAHRGVRVFKSNSRKRGHVPFDLAFCLTSKYPSSSMRTPRVRAYSSSIRR